jgi:Protein of unknown function (DUF2933)
VIASSLSPLVLLLALACPLMMVFMMRGGHGHGQGSHAGGSHGGGEQATPADAAQEPPSLDELRARLDELQAQIQALEAQDGDRVSAAP